MNRLPRAQPWLFPLFAIAFLLCSHLPFLSLPFFWDELGQFVPASLDLYQHGQWVPHTTLPNVHPPGLMAYLAVVWSITGYSLVATRVAILLLAAASLGAVWMLGEALNVRRDARRLAILLLLVSPLFYTQSMMVQLELPALLFTTLALALVLRGEYWLATLSCAVLVLMKETGALVPVLFAAWLGWRRQYWQAALILLSLAGLAVWLLILRSHTGHLLGNQEFARYNLFYPLHPVRLTAALLRRAYYLSSSSFHWIGTLSLLLAWQRKALPLFLTPAWGLAGTFLVLHTIEVSVLGGATLERYLLPVLPVLYLAMAVSFPKAIWGAAMASGLAVSLWLNPIYPFPFENNLAFTDFVRLHQAAASYLESHTSPAEPIATAWPLSDALRRPEFGYVTQAHKVQSLEDFREGQQIPAGLFVLYTRTWEPVHSVLHWPRVEQFLHRFYEYERPMRPEHLSGTVWSKLAEFHQRGQSVYLYRHY